MEWNGRLRLGGVNREPKRMEWILVSSACQRFRFVVECRITCGKRASEKNSYSQHNDCSCFRTSCVIWFCCCIKDWTTGTTKRNWKGQVFPSILNQYDKVAMAEGIVDLIAGVHQRRLFLLVARKGYREGGKYRVPHPSPEIMDIHTGCV